MNLLLEIQKGNEFAYRQLYDKYKVRVFNYFMKKVANEPDAEDLLQDTFLKLWRYRKLLNENYNEGQQLFYIARTVFIDYTRRQNKLCLIRKAVDIPPVLQLPFQESLIAHKEIQNILVKMPELRRKAFIMNKIEGFSYKEIARVLSVNIKTVDNNIARALKQIKKALLLFSFFLFFSSF